MSQVLVVLDDESTFSGMQGAAIYFVDGSAADADDARDLREVPGTRVVPISVLVNLYVALTAVFKS